MNRLTMLIKSDQKPFKLLHRLITASSNEGDLVVDPFGGSGSTFLSCKSLNRNCISFELDKNIYDIAIQHIGK